jgi:selenocysteine lyase/cysteine desulfurase
MQPVYDLAAAREQFPLVNDTIYLNHAGIGPIPQVTRKAVEETLGTLASLNDLGNIFGQLIPNVRQTIAQLVNAQPAEIAFAQNTAEGMNLAAHSLPLKAGDNVIVCNQEYPAVAYPFLNLDKRRGTETRVVPNDHGGTTVALLERHADANTRAVAVSTVEFATGFRTDLQAIGEWCKARNIWFLVDGIQSLGAYPLDVKACHVDILATGGHKWMLGPAGQGFFYVSAERIDELQPPFAGATSVANAGHFLEYDLTPAAGAARYEIGVPNLLGMVGLSRSVAFLMSLGIENIAAWTIHLTDLLLSELDRLGYQPIVNRDPAHRSAIVIFAPPPGGDIEAASKKLEEAHITHTLRNGTIRLAPHCYNTEDEIHAVIDCLKNAG